MPPSRPVTVAPSLSRALAAQAGSVQSDRLLRFRELPWADALAFMSEAVEDGLDAEEAIEAAAMLFDLALAFEAAVPGPAGAFLEAVDGPLIRAGLRLAWKVAQRRQRRQQRKAARKEATDG